MLRREQERVRSRRKRRLLKAAIVAAILLLMIGFLVALFNWEKHHETYHPSSDSKASVSADGPSEPDQERQTVRYDGRWYALRENIQTVLVLGLDSVEGESPDDASFMNDQRADFILLLCIDNDRKSCKALHINRDTMAEFSMLGVNGQEVGSTKGQLALAHTYGSGGQDSCRNTANAVSAYLYDTPIDHYLSITMNAVGILNDAVGGVTLTVLDDFTGIDSTLVKGKEVTLRGEQALRYVRARSGLEDSSNLRRMERQRQYMNALYAKFRSGGEIGVDVLLEISDYMVSDCLLQELTKLLDAVIDYNFEGIEAVKGESLLGEEFMEFYADEDALQKQIISLFYEPIE